MSFSEMDLQFVFHLSTRATHLTSLDFLRKLCDFSAPSPLAHLDKQNEDEDDLQGDGNQLQDPIGNVNPTRDGVVVGEDANSDGETAVDVDKEDAEQKKENVETVVNVALIDFQTGHLQDCQASGQDAEAVEDTVEHFPDVLEGHIRLTV